MPTAAAATAGAAGVAGAVILNSMSALADGFDSVDGLDIDCLVFPALAEFEEPGEFDLDLSASSAVPPSDFILSATRAAPSLFAWAT